jgi:hypothetical protein
MDVTKLIILDLYAKSKVIVPAKVILASYNPTPDIARNEKGNVWTIMSRPVPGIKSSGTLAVFAGLK